jgi:ribokinase
MNQPARLFVLGSVVIASSAKVARLPAMGESLKADSLVTEVGGKGLNLIAGALRLGVSVDGLLPVGDDLTGRFAEEAIAAHGIPRSMIRRYPFATGAGIGFADQEGGNCLAIFPGANQAVALADIRECEPAISGAEIVAAQCELDDAPIREAFSVARRAGVRTLLNLSPFRMVDRGLLELVSILIVNRVEGEKLVETLTGRPPSPEPFHLCEVLQSAGIGTVVATLGADGVVAVGPGGRRFEAAAIPITVVDPLGAGDAFAAAFMAADLAGADLQEKLEQGAAAGAIVASRPGVISALPTLPELTHFRSSHSRS